MKKFKLLGLPLRGSLSPAIHKLFAQQCGFDIEFALQEVQPEALGVTVQDFFQAGGCGLSITAPYKEQIIAQLQTLDLAASTAKAVNTVYIKNGTLHGTNTDGVGLIRDLAKQNIELVAKQILILGAGGAVRGILQNIINAKPATIIVSNRTQIKAEKLLADSNCANLIFKPMRELSAIHADVIIHAISSNLAQDFYAQINFNNSICYDLNYREQSNFLRLAALNKAQKCLHGLGMLIEQAAAAFYLWHAMKPSTDPVLENLQASINFAVL